MTTSNGITLEMSQRDYLQAGCGNLQGEVVFRDPKSLRFLMRSMIHRFLFTVEFNQEPQAAVAYSFLKASMVQGRYGLHVVPNPDYILSHQLPDADMFHQAIETCAGLGFLGQGLQYAGIHVQALNELRPKFCEYRQERGCTKTIQGSIEEEETWVKIHRMYANSAMLTAGFNCQPWSKLGDQRMSSDARSSVLIQLLHAAFHLRLHSIILECVPEAGSDKWVQKVLGDFCRQAGARLTQTNMSLQQIMPSRRDRWWCIITTSGLPPPNLHPLPTNPRPPTFGQLLPELPIWSDQEIEQLKLDKYDTRQFMIYGGIGRNLVKSDQPLQTALHAWSSQLLSCPCQCRQFPMSVARLEAKGLFGALMILDGTYTIDHQAVPVTRHIHPWELAAAVGVRPNQPWGPNLRLATCGLGQLASPVQAAWVGSHYMIAVADALGAPKPSPTENLWRLIQDIIVDITARIPSVTNHPDFVQFTANTKAVLHIHDIQTSPEPAIPFSVAPEHVAHSGEQTTEGTEEPQSTTSAPAMDAGTPMGSGPDEVTDSQLLQEVGKVDPSQAMTGSETDPLTPEETGTPTPAEAPEPVQVFAANGGIVAFANNDVTTPTLQSIGWMDSVAKPATDCMEIDSPPPKDDSPPPTPEVEHFPECGNEGFIFVQVPREPGTPASFVKVPIDSTVGMLSMAEHRLHAVTMPVSILDPVGVPLDIGATMSPYQQIHMRDLPRPFDRVGSPDTLWNHVQSYVDQGTTLDRLTLLHMQEGLVANDEFDCWLEQLVAVEQANMIAACVIHAETHPEDIRDRLMYWATLCSIDVTSHHPIATALVADGHWFPVVFSILEGKSVVFTTPEGKAWVEVGTQEMREAPTIREIELPTSFRNDCGFQSFGWLLHVLQHVNEETIPAVSPTSRTKAIHLRCVFEHHLCNSGRASQQVRPRSLGLGGAVSGDKMEALTQLLIEHGVPRDQAVARTETVISALGRAPVQGALRGPRPWKDIKGLANAASPKIQLVQASELAEAIRQKTTKKNHFGDKTKKKTRAQDRLPPTAVTASDVHIPDGLFMDHEGKLVKQIKIEEISPNAYGLVVTSSPEALRFLKASEAISSRPLALVVLDHQSMQMQGIGELLRTPAQCTHTMEPIIITCRMVQVGTGTIHRHVPTQKVQVEKVPNCVLRMVTFRDEFEAESHQTWDQFIQKPVKFLMQMFPELGDAPDQHQILDCWDRQFLTLLMQRTHPQESQLFIVSFRIQTKDVESITSKSGRMGVYVEPREADGRRPAAAYRVVWMGKSTKEEVQAALKQTKPWASIARTNRRYGVRVRVADAPAVHQQHKPSVPYLDTNRMLEYMGGPFPYGATRSTLSKLFSSWLWPARPIQPTGRTPNGLGVMWSIQASQKPQFQVYTLAHSDVLLTEMPKQTKRNQGSLPDIQGSTKTLDAIKYKGYHSSQRASGAEDPFQTDDPWKSKAARTAPDNVGPQATMDAKCAQMEKRITQQVQEQLAHSHGAKPDEEMPGDDRTGALEQRLAALEQNVQSQHQQQAQHNQDMATQVHQLSQRVDQQSVSMQRHLDSKMSEQ
eukprot:Skav202417  [mRNA]  locus=scaffold1370:243671:248356:- [translate_table: standard]